MKNKMLTRLRSILMLLALTQIINLVLVTQLSAQSATDHFKSVQSGNWGSLMTWQQSSDGINWTTSTLIPGGESASIIISSGDSVFTTANLTVNKLIIQPDAMLNVGSEKNMTVNNSDGIDLDVYGKIRLNSSIKGTFDIVMRNGSQYIRDLNKTAYNNGIINSCTWEDGSALKLVGGDPMVTLTNLNQNFHDFIWDGSNCTKTSTNVLGLPNNFNITGDLTFISTNSSNLVLTSSSSSSLFTINGNVTLMGQSFIILSTGGPVTLNIGGDLNIGAGQPCKFSLETANTPHLVNLNGSLNIAILGKLHSTNNTLGTIAFTNVSDTQYLNFVELLRFINYRVERDVNLVCNSVAQLRVSSGYSLTISSGGSLTHNNISNENIDYDKIIIEDGGSLISSAIGLRASVKRLLYNADWNVPLDGWHLLSSPVESQSLSSGGFTNGNYDFYMWNETQNLWLNQKIPENEILSFIPGTGYFVAYDDGGIKTFTGILNSAPITLSNLTITGSSPYGGYHLLGNPFPSAIDWSADGWDRAGVSEVAMVWNEKAMNYIPVTSTVNNIIPSMQGFFIQVLDEINSITIPASAKCHSNVLFNKSAATDMLHLSVKSKNNETYDEAVVRLANDASLGLDFLDGHEMEGSATAPQLYTIANNEMMCVNTLPISDLPSVIPLNFKPGSDNNYRLSVNENSIMQTILLEDILTGNFITLDDSTFYEFTASPTDKAERFRLHTGTLGLPEKQPVPCAVYSYGNTIYFRQNTPANRSNSCTICDIRGNTWFAGTLNSGKLISKDFPDLPTGIYFVMVTSEEGRQVFKVLIQN